MKRHFIASMVLVAALANQAYAETTFNASVTNADGQLLTTLMWSSDRRDCVASGHESWSGEKPSTGSETLPAITLSGTYTLTLTCSSPPDSTATLTWMPPTKNTDGSPLTDLASYKVYWGTAPGTYQNSAQVNNPGLSSYVVEQLTPGAWHFVVTAINSRNVESAFSNPAMKTIASLPPEEESVTLTVNPVPEAPSDLAVQ